MKLLHLALALVLAGSSAQAAGPALVCQVTRDIQVPSSDPDISFETKTAVIPETLRGAELIVAGHTQVALEIPVSGLTYQAILSWGDQLFLEIRDANSGARARFRGDVQLAKPNDSVSIELESSNAKLTCTVVPKLPDELSPECRDDCAPDA